MSQPTPREFLGPEPGDRPLLTSDSLGDVRTVNFSYRPWGRVQGQHPGMSLPDPTRCPTSSTSLDALFVPPTRSATTPGLGPCQHALQHTSPHQRPRGSSFLKIFRPHGCLPRSVPWAPGRDHSFRPVETGAGENANGFNFTFLD